MSKNLTLQELEDRARRRGDEPALRLIEAIREADAKHRNPMHAGADIPKVGEDIYISGAMYIDHGEDDRMGGLAEVTKVELKYNSAMVSVKEAPGTSFNWLYLKDIQERLKAEHGEGRARPDPDYG